jgi:hypothetical protein
MENINIMKEQYTIWCAVWFPVNGGAIQPRNRIIECVNQDGDIIAIMKVIKWKSNK